MGGNALAFGGVARKKSKFQVIIPEHVCALMAAPTQQSCSGRTRGCSN